MSKLKFTASAFVPKTSLPKAEPEAAPEVPAEEPQQQVEEEAVVQQEVEEPAAEEEPAQEEEQPQQQEEEEEEGEVAEVDTTPATQDVVAEATPEAAEEASTGADVAGEADEGDEEADEDEEDDDTDAAIAAVEEESSLIAVDAEEKEHLTLCFLGHVDAGKSTISGQVLLLNGEIDKRTVEKYEREAKSQGRDSWWLAYILDINEEERAKGKTVEVGRAHFETDVKRYTILDAPGHAAYVPNMIGGAAQADLGVLVISARKGEFETGFDRGGQTREHTLLAKTLGVSHLIVVVNKMDDKTVEWRQERFDQIKSKLTPYLKKTGFNPKAIQFVPMSGLTGEGVKDRLDSSVCPWYTGPSLLETMDGLKPVERDASAPLRIPVLDTFKERGSVYALGKVESGTIRVGQKVVVMPGAVECTVSAMNNDFKALKTAYPGENLHIVLKGIQEAELNSGYMLCAPSTPCRVVSRFEAQLILVDLPEHKPLFTVGYQAVLHMHTASLEVTCDKLVRQLDRKGKPVVGKTGRVARPRYVKKGSIVVARFSSNEHTFCAEEYSNIPQLGRFTLRDEGTTIAIGKILKLPKSS